MQGRHCHAKFLEAAEKAARQFRRYEGAEGPAVVSEGEEHPTLRWLAKGDKHDWTNAVAEVLAYNSDFQVRQPHAYVAGNSLLLETGCAECLSMSEWVPDGQFPAQTFAEADSGSSPDSGRASSRSNADSARLSHRYCLLSSCLPEAKEADRQCMIAKNGRY